MSVCKLVNCAAVLITPDLRRAVRVEPLESVLGGGEVCRVAVHPPPDIPGDHGAERC